MILSWPTIVNLIVTDPFIECNNIKNYTDDEIVNEAKNNSYRVFPNRLTNKPLQPNLTDTHSANSRYVIFKLYSAISFGNSHFSDRAQYVPNWLSSDQNSWKPQIYQRANILEQTLPSTYSRRKHNQLISQKRSNSYLELNLDFSVSNSPTTFTMENIPKFNRYSLPPNWDSPKNKYFDSCNTNSSILNQNAVQLE